MKTCILKLSFLLLTILLTACSNSDNINNDTASNDDNTNQSLLTSNANVRLGIAYLQKDDASAAKEKLLTSLREDPTNPAAWYSLAYYYEATGNQQQAEQNYLKAIKLAPQSGTPKNNYGTFLCRQGRYDDAIKQFMAAANSPGYIDEGRAYENAGICAALIPNYKQAKNFFTKALYNNPNLPTSLLELSKIDYQQGKVAEAKRLYDRFLSLNEPLPGADQFGKQLMYRQPNTQLALPSPKSMFPAPTHTARG